MDKNKKKKICIVATIPFALLVFMTPHILALSQIYDVTLISSGKAADLKALVGRDVKFVSVSIERDISLFRDIDALYRLCVLFRRHRFDVVHSLMPKAGLLAMLAALLSRVPLRIHTFTGQVWANKRGIKRGILKSLDKVTAFCATNLLTDSASQRSFLINSNVSSERKIQVLGRGSVCGVDMGRFKPNLLERNRIRFELGIPDDAIVYLYLGRLNRDKGILDLAEAFRCMSVDLPNAHLLVVGPDENEMGRAMHAILKENLSKFHLLGFTDRPEAYMASSDIFCLPSYREGFGSVIIEAAAAGIPTIASRIYGLTDSVVDGETGILHEAGNVPEIRAAMYELCNNLDKRVAMAQAARNRAQNYFTTEIIRQEMLNFYSALLK